jgi:hypothetical protein
MNAFRPLLFAATLITLGIIGVTIRMVPSQDQSPESSSKGFIPRTLHVFSFADDVHPGVCHIASAVLQAGVPLRMLGWNHSARFFDHTSCGARCDANLEHSHRLGQEKKVEWLHHLSGNYQKQGILPDDLILFTDAFDVIIQRPVTDVLKIFPLLTNHQKGIVLNGEPVCGDSFLLDSKYGKRLRRRNFEFKLNEDQDVRTIQGKDMCGLMASKTQSVSFHKGPNWSLGSGGFVGDPESLKLFFRRLLSVRSQMVEYQGDQILFQLTYLRYPEINMFIDVAADLFLVMSPLIGNDDLEKFDAEGCTEAFMNDTRPSALRSSRKQPVFLHFPGEHREKYANCCKLIITQEVQSRREQYFVDTDRDETIRIHDICPEYVA